MVEPTRPHEADDLVALQRRATQLLRELEQIDTSLSESLDRRDSLIADAEVHVTARAVEQPDWRAAADSAGLADLGRSEIVLVQIAGRVDASLGNDG